MKSVSNKCYEANEAVKRNRERWGRRPGFQGLLEPVQRLRWEGTSVVESGEVGSAVGKGPTCVGTCWPEEELHTSSQCAKKLLEGFNQGIRTPPARKGSSRSSIPLFVYRLCAVPRASHWATG